MPEPPSPPRAPFSIALAIAAPLAAILLYLGALGRPLDVPDLDFVSDSPRAAAELPSDQIWAASFPPERGDLGMYRPALAQALKLEYKNAPGSVRALRSTNLVLFALLVSLFHLLAWRLIRSNLARAVAVFTVVLHPVASESLNLVVGQGALIAVTASIAAMLLYLLSAEGRLAFWIASPLAAFLYFVAFGSHEAACLLPLSLLAIEFLRPAQESHAAATAAESAIEAKGRKKKRKRQEADAASAPEPAPRKAAPPQPLPVRLAAFAFPMAVAAIILLALRWIALDGALGARMPALAFFGEGAPSPLVGGAMAALVGAGRLALPWPQTLFHPVRYEALFQPSAALGLAVLAALALAPRFLARRPERACVLGALLALIPLLGLLQIVPLNAAITDRTLLLALPGFALCLGAAVSSLVVTNSAEESYLPTEKAAIVACAVLLAFFGLQTFARNLHWRDPAMLWAAERRQHPSAPQPVAYALIAKINDHTRAGKAFTPESLGELDAMTSQTLRLAKPPDADPVLQFVALTHAFRGDLPAAKSAVERALAAPGPHTFGFFQSIGSIALQAGFPDLAESAFKREIKRSPTDFNSNYKLADIEIQRKNWAKAVEFSQKARSEAPSHLRAQTFLREGVASAQIKTPEGIMAAARALTKAIDLEPKIGEAYILLARLFVDDQQFGKAEQVLMRGRSNAPYATYADLFAVQVDSLERQKLSDKVVDFLAEMTRIYNWDMPLSLYAGTVYLRHNQPAKAREMFQRVLASQQLPPQDALFGMARIAAEFDRDDASALRWTTDALRAAPGHPGALALYQRLAGKPFNPSDLQPKP